MTSHSLRLNIPRFWPRPLRPRFSSPLLPALIVLLLFSCFRPNPSRAYLPPPERIIEKCLKTTTRPSFVQARGNLQVTGPDSSPAGVVFSLRLFLTTSNQARLELFSASFPSGLTVIVVNNNLLLASPEPRVPKILGRSFLDLLPLLVGPFVSSQTRSYRDQLQARGIDFTLTGLEHFDREIVYRIGSPLPGEPRLWIQKTDFSPRRFFLPRVKPLTIDYLEYQLLSNKSLFPTRIEISSGESPWIKIRFESISLSESFPPALFSPR